MAFKIYFMFFCFIGFNCSDSKNESKMEKENTIISEEKIISDDGRDTVFVKVKEINKVRSTEIYLYENKSGTISKIGKIRNEFIIVSVFYIHDELSLFGILGTGIMYTYCFKRRDYCREKAFDKWYDINEICNENSAYSLDIIDRFGISDVKWAGGSVLKVRQIKENVPEKVFALIGSDFVPIYENELIQKQKYFNFSKNYNKFSKYLNKNHGKEFGLETRLGDLDCLSKNGRFVHFKLIS